MNASIMMVAMMMTFDKAGMRTEVSTLPAVHEGVNSYGHHVNDLPCSMLARMMKNMRSAMSVLTKL